MSWCWKRANVLQTLSAAALTAGLVGAAIVFPVDRADAQVPAFTGAYAINFDGSTQSVNGQPMPTNSYSKPFAFLSNCNPNGCAATGVELQDLHTRKIGATAFTLAFNPGPGAWEGTTTEKRICDTNNIMTSSFTDVQVMWGLQPGPDGVLRGFHQETYAWPCQRTIHTFVNATSIGPLPQGLSF